MEQAAFPLGHRTAISGLGRLSCGACGFFIGLKLLQLRLDQSRCRLAGAMGQRLIPSLDVPRRFRREFLCRQRLVRPCAQRRAGHHRAGVAKTCARRRQRGERRKRGVGELLTVAVCDCRITHKALDRAQLGTRALQEETRRARLALDHLAKRANVVRADERVIPRERGRVAGVVHDAREELAVGAGDARDEHGVIGGASRIEAAGPELPLRVPEVAMRREITAAVAVGDVDGRELGQRFLHQTRRAFRHAAEIAGNQIPARQRRAFQPHQPRAVSV